MILIKRRNIWSFRRAIAVILIFAALPNCTVLESIQPPPESEIEQYPEATLPPRPAYNLSGYPPAMQDGYIDGCESAKDSPYGKKDETRYTTDGQYRMGWDDGYDMCKNKTEQFVE